MIDMAYQVASIYTIDLQSSTSQWLDYLGFSAFSLLPALFLRFDQTQKEDDEPMLPSELPDGTALPSEPSSSSAPLPPGPFAQWNVNESRV